MAKVLGTGRGEQYSSRRKLYQEREREKCRYCRAKNVGQNFLKELDIRHMGGFLEEDLDFAPGSRLDQFQES